MSKRGRKLLESIKKIQNHTASKIATTHGIAMSIFLVSSEILNYLVYPELSEGVVKFIIMVFLDAILYYVIYKITKTVIEYRININNPKFDIQGEWYHVHIPHIWNEIDYSRVNLRCGFTIIKREMYDFSFSGENSNYCVENGEARESGTPKKTTWNTIVSEMSETLNDDYDIIEVYKATTTESSKLNFDKCPLCEMPLQKTLDAGQNRYGVHKYKIELGAYDEKLGYVKMTAKYSDCWPSYKNGELLLFRKKEDRDKMIVEYFEEKMRREQ